MKCVPGEYQENSEQDKCNTCEAPRITAEHGQTVCKLCDLGTAYESPSECKICVAGYYNDDQTHIGGCKKCPFNTITTLGKLHLLLQNIIIIP